ncbi:MAG TPA: hypothetical protein ACFCUD_08090 [Cyclobacteriaceae bacterium]
MKYSVLSVIIFFATYYASAQQIIKPGEIMGVWKLQININDELNKEAGESETIFEELVIKSVGTFVDGVINEIDIYFEFLSNYECIIQVKAFDEEDISYGEWKIKNGKLYISDDGSPVLDFDNDDAWLLKDGLLIPDPDDEANPSEVYMIKIK